jgi:hypothetical protein
VNTLAFLPLVLECTALGQPVFMNNVTSGESPFAKRGCTAEGSSYHPVLRSGRGNGFVLRWAVRDGPLALRQVDRTPLGILLSSQPLHRLMPSATKSSTASPTASAAAAAMDDVAAAVDTPDDGGDGDSPAMREGSSRGSDPAARRSRRDALTPGEPMPAAAAPGGTPAAAAAIAVTAAAVSSATAVATAPRMGSSGGGGGGGPRSVALGARTAAASCLAAGTCSATFATVRQ